MEKDTNEPPRDFAKSINLTGFKPRKNRNISLIEIHARIWKCLAPFQK